MCDYFISDHFISYFMIFLVNVMYICNSWTNYIYEAHKIVKIHYKVDYALKNNKGYFVISCFNKYLNILYNFTYFVHFFKIFYKKYGVFF